MTTTGILCHCGAGPDGHGPGTGDCDTTVRTGRNGHDGCRRDHTYFCADCHGGARGTCPACGRTAVKVVRVETRGLVESTRVRRKGETAWEFIVRHRQLTAELRRNPHGPLLRVRPALVAHRTPGRGAAPCGGAGRVPTETRYTPGRDLLTDWIATYGPDSVTTTCTSTART